MTLADQMISESAPRPASRRSAGSDLVEAAYLTFLEHGFNGMTMARIGERAGMSHGIVNYYFKSKDELLSAVVRKANFLIMQDTARRLRLATTPRRAGQCHHRRRIFPPISLRATSPAPG